MFRRLAVIVVLAILGGCGSPYINLPGVEGDMASHDVNDINVRKVEAKALAYLLTRQPPTGQYAVALPPGSLTSTYNQVLAAVPAGGDRVTDADATIPVYRVAQVQVRGLSGQVDIIRPVGDGQREELYSVFLETDIDGWYAAGGKLWHVPVDQALALARFEQPKPDKESEPAPAQPAESPTTPEPAPQSK
ncbi:MAG: hypothetical protein GC162_12390 [Planctomycetes bacterium]|nr:hypothetical protein [Planctomycetota bacterium]